jgi:hypothetical protein
MSNTSNPKPFRNPIISYRKRPEPILDTSVNVDINANLDVNTNTNVKPVLNYRSACLTENKNATQYAKQEKVEEVKEEPTDLEIWLLTVEALAQKWDKYKADYIKNYSEDEYRQRYETPNYWVAPDYDSEEEEDTKTSSDISDQDYYSDYSKY